MKIPSKNVKTKTGWNAALLIVAVGLTVFAQAAFQQTAAPESQPKEISRVEAEVDRLASLSGGLAGVAAVHLETGRTVLYNPDTAFPMASTYKVAIAAQLLRRVDSGDISLDQMLALSRSDLHPGSGTISRLLDDPGVALSLRNLLELMLIISDNSATDVVLATAGGPRAVTARMRELGIDGLRVDRPTLELIADWAGIRLPTDTEWDPDRFADLYREVPDLKREAAAIAFNADLRDTSTPRAMTTLLEKIWRGEALSPSSTQLLLDIMRRCETGQERIKGMLPPYVETAHKTGTIGGTTNDVGIITLPGNAGHVAISVFIKESEAEVPEREKAVAHIARAIYDFFLLSTESER